MPSGMWSIFGNASDMLFDDDSEAGQDEVIEYLLENYQDLYDAAQEGWRTNNGFYKDGEVAMPSHLFWLKGVLN